MKIIDKHNKVFPKTSLNTYVAVSIRHYRKVKTPTTLFEEIFTESVNCEKIVDTVYTEIIKTLFKLGVEVSDLRRKIGGFRITINGGAKIICAVKRSFNRLTVVIKIVKPIPLSSNYPILSSENSKNSLLIKKIIDMLNSLKLQS